MTLHAGSRAAHSPLSSLPSEAKIEEEQQQKQLLLQEEFARLESVVMRFRAEGRVSGWCCLEKSHFRLRLSRRVAL